MMVANTQANVNSELEPQGLFKEMVVLQPIVPAHDAILPLMYKGIKWGCVNLGDNTESHNASIVDIFSRTNEYLAAMSLRTDAFVPGPPTIALVKDFHNMFVRLNNMIDTNTKTNMESRLEAQHITHERKMFTLYPVRYYDMKNATVRRWIELCMQGLCNMAQLSENTWTNDFSVATAIEMKKLFREAYRLMCVELFQVDLKTAATVFDDAKPYFLTQVQFDNYNTNHIPTIEWIRSPAIGKIFTEDELRVAFQPRVLVGVGVPEGQPNLEQRGLEGAADRGQTVK